jgi:Ca-activated chloride channel family protein
MLLLAPLPLVAWWLLPPQRERVSALRVPFFDRIAASAGAEPRAGAIVRRRVPLQLVVASLVWLLIVAGLARPEWVGEPIVRSEAARDVMLAIDLSGSMDYRDFPGEQGQKITRLEAVQQVVDRFIAARQGDRVGLIVFGSKAYLQVPFTRDLESARALVELMAVGMAGPQTALGDAIGLAIRAFESSAADKRLLILLTDGNDTASAITPVNAAEIGRMNRVEIHTIGIGDPNASGEERVDFEVLREIAGRTWGLFFAADDQAQLTDVYRRIDETAAADVRTESWRPRESLVHWPAGAAVCLILLAYATLLIRSRAGVRPA